MAATAEALVRQWFDELWNQGREDTIDRLLSPQAKVHGLTPSDQPIIGREAFKPFFRKFRSAFPDMKIAIDRTVSQGDLCAAHCSCTGTHLGEGFGKATKNPVKFHGICIVRADNGQLVEGWNCFDFMTAFQQIGLLPQLQA